VRKVNKIDGKKTDGKPGSAVNTNSSGVVIVTGVAKKKVDKKKGELIEQNQDGLEVQLHDIWKCSTYHAVCCLIVFYDTHVIKDGM
jgi:methionine-rich copper-binding protein CopC